MRPTEVTTWHLEQRSPDDLRPAPVPAAPVTIVRVGAPSAEFSRFLYAAVGRDWWWYSRLTWTREQWTAWVTRPEVETWVVYGAGVPTGYFELEHQPPGDVEIVYFGLLPPAIGRGIGGWMLTEALRRAWAIAGTTRVWLHTCTLDGPHARANYQARGLRVFDTVVAIEELPDEMPALFPD